MFSTPLICSSMGATTVEATISALAPGYWPATLMIGGAISGYCATGRRVNETTPRMTNTIETTEAKIGRSMKKCEIFMPASVGLRLRRGRGRGRGALLLRGDLSARARPHHSVHHHPIGGREARLDHPQVADKLAEGDVFLADLVVGAHHQHVFARLLGADGRIGHEQRRIGGRARDLHAREHAGREQGVGVV